MMDIVVPETCWASNKICNKNHLLHLVGILFPHINCYVFQHQTHLCFYCVTTCVGSTETSLGYIKTNRKMKQNIVYIYIYIYICLAKCNYIQYFLHLVLFSLCAFLLTVFVLRVLLSSYVYLFYFVYLLYLICICCTLCVFVILCVYCCSYLHAGLLARSQYPEGPVTGHLDTGFSWFPCVYKRKLRWFPSFQVATTCLSCSLPCLNFLLTFFPPYLCTCKITTATGW